MFRIPSFLLRPAWLAVAALLLAVSAHAEVVISRTKPIDAAEMQRRLRICLGSEPWLREACLQQLGKMDLGATAATAPEPPAAVAIDELHMIGIYEPRIARGADGRAVSEEVTVQVNRPGKAVELVLSSYTPARWRISTTPGTRIAQVVLAGYGRARSEARLDEAPVAVTRSDLPLAFEAQDARFQRAHEAAARLAGLPRAASFHGSYRAPAEGFVIADAPGLQIAQEVEREALSQGMDPAQLSPVLRAALLPGAAQSLWRFTATGFVRGAAPEAQERRDAPLDVPQISWPIGAAYDPEGQRLWGVSFGGEGYLYRYDMAAGAWAAWSMDNYDAGGLIYDAAADRLITTPGITGAREFRILNPKGQVLDQLAIDRNAFPGLDGLRGQGGDLAPFFRPLAVDGPMLLIETDALRRPPTQRLRYLVDLTTGKVTLIKPGTTWAAQPAP